MADFINFFTKGQVGNTNLTDIFTKTIPQGFVSIGFPPLPPLKPLNLPPIKPITIDPAVKAFFTTPPPPVDAGVKQFFTTGTTDALDKMNKQSAKDLGFDKPVDAGVKQFFTTGTTDSLDKSNAALGKILGVDKPIDAGVKEFFTTGRTDALDKSNADFVKFVNTDLKNTASTVGKDLEKMVMAPTNMMSSLTGALSSPLLLPAIMIIGGIVVIQMVNKK